MARFTPERGLTYLSTLFDSRNWDLYQPRPGDVVISTSYKSGTTWMQNILRQLVFPGPAQPPVSEVSPWIDRRNPEIALTMARLEAQTHRRFVKSHLPLTAMPYYREVRYIVVARDPRDVFMSFWNHYSGMTEAYFARQAVSPPDWGPPLPRCPADIHALWADWIQRGWFPWESDGWPHSGNLFHTASWWPARDLPNVLFVHFADLLRDPPGEIARVAAHVGIGASPERRAEIAGAVGLEALRADADGASPMPLEAMAATWKAGPATFFNQGTNGRWRGVLTAQELALYDAAKARCLPPAAGDYLERGRAALPPRAAAPRPQRAPAGAARNSEASHRPISMA